MLELSALGEWLQSKLNSQLSQYITKNEDTLLNTSRVVYMFRIYTDQGEHKGYDYIDNMGNISIEPQNKIVRYIEAILTQTDSDVEATTYTSVTRDTQLEILIPLNDYAEVEQRKQITEEIRNVMDTAFSKNGGSYLADENVVYKFNYKYSLTTTGSRNNRIYVGDSLTMYAFINFFYVEEGVNSSDFILSIDNEVITPLRIGFNRGISQQTNVFSDDTSATARNTPTSSLFSINFDAVARTTPFFKEIYKHLLTGRAKNENNEEKPNLAHLVVVSLVNTSYTPTGKETTETIAECTRLMSIENVALNGQIPLMASVSVTLTETKYFEGLTNLSPEAYYYIDHIGEAGLM